MPISIGLIFLFTNSRPKSTCLVVFLCFLKSISSYLPPPVLMATSVLSPSHLYYTEKFQTTRQECLYLQPWEVTMAALYLQFLPFLPLPWSLCSRTWPCREPASSRLCGTPRRLHSQHTGSTVGIIARSLVPPSLLILHPWSTCVKQNPLGIYISLYRSSLCF